MDDKDLTSASIQDLSSRDGVASFFAGLGYRTDSRLPQTAAAMGISAESLQRQLRHIERLAVHDDGAEPLDVYLIELTSVTIATTQGLARALRNRAGNYLLILTDDYERLDFVLLERTLPASPTAGLATRQVAVRPRVLTVNRRSPSVVQLRVLRRFTYSEADSDAQYEKLLSAYGVADWSEPLFNNRALFSDYYLNQRLPERPEWSERPESDYHALRELFTSARQRLSGQTAAVTREQLIEPALAALGFQASSTSGSPAAPYRLHASDPPGETLALCLAYTWNRNLDGRDETRDAESSDENPGASVVALLDSGEAPWAIVTNGKVWRLYSARAHSRATNYYEIDLDETLAMSDPNLAFRYFWLIFRAAAFGLRDIEIDGETWQMSFLDELVGESESYAKGLGERLKEQVFEEIFPHFAEGFIEYLRAQPPITGSEQAALLPVAQQLALKQEPDEAFRRQVFLGTLTFLYRLLFLLYGESRDLLPVKEVRGYWELSLTHLKEEIAAKAGDIADEKAAKLRKAYSSDSTALYDRLLKLFGVIDKGSRDLNVPLYNGGLFLTDVEGSDQSPEAESARFLLQNKIPDRHLALGLDSLARSIDEKRQSLVFIDYKSMGVRQLGSIYEGLLEFKVRMAPEKMAIVEGRRKGTEEIIPYREATRTKEKVLTIGRGANATERVYSPGEVYLENDKKERKATGSYYTPDHIVKYIVENAVGPVLAERLGELRPRFREAQQAYRAAEQRAEGFRRQGMQPDDPGKVVKSFTDLVDALFDLRVLDPSMGSGHFLVEAVDFICDRMLGQRDGFLQAFPWNPVTAFLDETRRSILTEMERQAVSIDASRLTDINLLKRHVLKRCVYGVDLNPMAVELAKVSLWLDCFTLGAPLSFLDHHLKCGNSLIGTAVQEVEEEIAAQRKGHVADLFGGPFQGLLAATALIEELRRIPDATVEQAERSHGLFAEFEKSQDPYKRALDIWVSRQFGNGRAEEYLTLVGRDFASELTSNGEALSVQYREVIQRARELGADRRFFHWDLEFPEAFIDLQRKTWKSVKDQGFHAVVGNPPYDVLSTEELGYEVSPELAYYRATATFLPAVRGKTNLYKLFICRALQLMSPKGALSFIVPMALLGDDQSREVRKVLIEATGLTAIEGFPQKDDPRHRVFVEAKLSTAIFVTRSESNDLPATLRTHPGGEIGHFFDELVLRPSQLTVFDPDNLTIPSCTQRDWNLAMGILNRGLHRLGESVVHRQGEVNETTSKAFLSEAPIGSLVLRGAAISLYAVREASQGQRLYLDVERYLLARGSRENTKAWDHRYARIGFQRSSPQNNFRRLIAAPIEPGQFCFDTVSYVTSATSSMPLDLLLVLLNSKVLDWYFRLGSTNSKVNEYQFNNLPVPAFSDLEANILWRESFEKAEWGELARLLCDASGNGGIVPREVQDALVSLSRRIQEVESTRILKNRSERSRLSAEAQPIQEVIDAVLFRCYGLSKDESEYVVNRLKEML